MNRLLWLSVLTSALVLTVPNTSQADSWGWPQSNQGFTWWEGRALRCGSWIHMHGPLYSYGPYNTYGYINMYVPNPWHNAYVPAYPASWYGYPNPERSPYGYYSWNGVGVNLGYPNQLTGPPPGGSFMNGPMQSATPRGQAEGYYGNPSPGYFQATPNVSR
jgi:hypothetical protein